MTTLAGFDQDREYAFYQRYQVEQGRLYRSFVEQGGLSILAELKSAALDYDQWLLRRSCLTEFFRFYGVKRTSNLLRFLTDGFPLLCYLIGSKAEASGISFDLAWCAISISSRDVDATGFRQALQGMFSDRSIRKGLEFLVDIGIVKRRSAPGRRYEYAISVTRWVELFNQFQGGVA